MNKKAHNHFYKKDGFTYVELLIVVGIMIIFGVFFVMAVDPVGKIKAQRDSQRKSDINSILLSVEQKIRNDRGWNCPAGPLPQDKFTAIGTGPGEYDLYSCLTPNYLNKYLVDPKEGSIAGRDITDGLVGHWKFDEGEGITAYDASGNDNHGTLVNGPSWVDGKMGGALEFDGVDNYVDCGDDPSLNLTDAITIGAWVKGPYQFKNLVRRYASGNGYLFQLYKWTNPDRGGLKFTVYKDGANVQKWGSFPDIMKNNEWNHVAIVWESGSTIFYVNGVSNNQGVGDITSIGSVDTNLYISSPENGLNSIIDDVRIYDRALSPEEIQDLYNYEYSSKYAIWQNPVTKNVSLKSLENETKEVSTGAPD